MRNVLLVTYYFPPQPEAGSVRAAALARYLADFGWTPTAVTLASGTPPPLPAHVVSAPNLLVPSFSPVPPSDDAVNAAPRKEGVIRRITAPIRRAYWRGLYLVFPDPAVAWIPGALFASARAARARRFDAVVSSAHPFSAHLVGAALARRWNVPWIADYRDLWTGYPYASKSAFRRSVERRLEIATVRRATAITTVSPALGDALTSLFPHGRVAVIPNGVDAAALNGVTPGSPDGFRLVYAGHLYNGRRNPEALFAAARALRDAGDAAGHALKIDFYGGDEQFVTALAERYGIADAVRAFGRIDREAVLSKQREAAVLLVLLSLHPATAQEYGSKIFEYESMKRPVLALGPAASVVRTYLAESGLGDFAHDARSCAEALRRAYARYEAGQYEPSFSPAWRPFTTRDLAQRFAELLDAATASAGERGGAPSHSTR